MSTSLPVSSRVDSAEGTRLFFDAYGKEPLEFGATDIDATIGFFEKRGFGSSAANSVAAVVLKQAKLDNVPVFQLLDTLKEFDGVQLSALITEILNNNRSTTSTLGYKFVDVEKQNQTRNILP
jgi:hypothetical protein